MHEARMAHEVWESIKGEDWVLTAGTLKDWVRKVWDFDKPYQHPGRDLGTATQFGLSLGVAYAYKDTDKIVGLEIGADEQLRLRYRVIVHAETASEAGIAAAWADWATPR